LNTKNGGNFSLAAFAAMKTVMFSLPCPLVAQREAVPVSRTTLILLESKQKLVSTRFHTCLGEMLFVTSLKISKYSGIMNGSIFFFGMLQRSVAS
jgi:hypothetical protein